ncbi:MAG TPA: hypothetical protein VGD12_18080, partial [Blastococcus sp.]
MTGVRSRPVAFGQAGGPAPPRTGPRQDLHGSGPRDAGPRLGVTMSSLSERLTRGAASSPSQVDHARRLVA